MTGTMLGVTIFEFALVVLIITGLIYEKKLIEIEDKLGTILGTAIGKFLRRLIIKRKAKAGKHLRAVPAKKQYSGSERVSDFKNIA